VNVPDGYVVLVLHAHLPYVRPDGPVEMLEERWFFEALSETYLPLCRALARAPARLAISLSAPLIAMLEDGEIMARYRRHLVRTLELCLREERWDPELARYYRDHYAGLIDMLEGLDWRPLEAFRRLHEAGRAELLTAVGSHGYLPLVATRGARRLQIEAGLARFAAAFGRRPSGIWLPECAYEPGLDHLLAAAGVRWTVLEEETVAAALPAPAGVPHTPVLSPAGVACFPRDRAASLQVWASGTGYPGDASYREFYKDIAYDRPYEYIRPYIVDGRVRYDTGLKYHRVTGPGTDLNQKERYDPRAASDRARMHATHFAKLLHERCRFASRTNPIVTLPFDMELFGHWWWEGPLFLQHLFPLLQQMNLACAAPSDLLELLPDLPVGRIPAGSWGDGGDHRVWLAPENLWLYPLLERMEEMVTQLAAFKSPLAPEAAERLLLAQASDWAFMLSLRSSPDFARRRLQELIAPFGLVAPVAAEEAAAAEAGPAPVTGVADTAAAGESPRVFPGLDLSPVLMPLRPLPERLRVLHLAWEYPPDLAGGLGRHVCDLAQALAALGDEVHVLTLAGEMAADHGRAPPERGGAPPERGVTVHRVDSGERSADFLDWVYRFNQRMVRAALSIGPFDLLHAHDWLVGQAGRQLAARWQVPLVATIHALEKGRHGGIFTDLQQAVHLEEWELVRDADRVITVSRAMAADVSGTFKREQIAPIPNGVSPPPLPPAEREGDLILFTGRLVHEKGVAILLEAIARMERPVRAVIAGRGPAASHLAQLARQLGVADRVRFAGFIPDEAKFRLLAACAAAVVPSLYEPFGIVALEAMAMEAATVASRTGGLAEIIRHGEDGLLVTPGDPGELAGALDRLLSDPAFARRLGAAARQRVCADFTWEEVALQTRAVYRSAYFET
jgi:1,4-alpha-glucan branching enzyme